MKQFPFDVTIGVARRCIARGERIIITLDPHESDIVLNKEGYKMFFGELGEAVYDQTEKDYKNAEEAERRGG